MERARRGVSRRVWGRVAASWLALVAALAWLSYVAEPQGTAGRVVQAISTCALAPLVFDWCTLLPWLAGGWRAEWLANFTMAILSLTLLLAYAIRPSRVTAALSIGGVAWWSWIAYLGLSR